MKCPFTKLNFSRPFSFFFHTFIHTKKLQFNKFTQVKRIDLDPWASSNKKSFPEFCFHACSGEKKKKKTVSKIKKKRVAIQVTNYIARRAVIHTIRRVLFPHLLLWTDKMPNTMNTPRPLWKHVNFHSGSLRTAPIAYFTSASQNYFFRFPHCLHLEQ